MKKKALRKDFYMELKKSMNRFLSIFAIVAMGVAFYTGIQATAPDMRESGDAYFDVNELMDVKITSTMGMTDADMEAIAELENIRKVEPGYMADVYWGGSESARVVRVESVSPTMNQLSAKVGRLPEAPGEIFLDIEFMEANGLELGDEIVLVEAGDWNSDDGTGDDETDGAAGSGSEDAEDGDSADDDSEDEDDAALKEHTFTLVGAGSSPLYISFVRGNTTLGTGEVDGNAFILEEDFDYDIYTHTYIQVEGSETLNAYSDAYEEVVERVMDELEGIAPERCQIRYDEVMAEANEELADAKKELEDGKKEADEELAEAWQEILDGEQEIADAEQEIADALAEIADNKKLLKEKEAELADAKAELADGEQKYADGLAEFEENEAKFNEEYPDALKQIEEGEAAISEASMQLNLGWTQYDEGESQLRHAQIEIDEGKAKLEEAKKTLSAGWDEYNAGAAELEAKEQELEAGESAFAAGISDLGAQLRLPAGAGQEEVFAVLEGMKAQYEASPDETMYRAWVESGLEAAYENLKATSQQLSEGRAQLEAAKEQMAAAKAKLDAGQSELDASEAQLEAGQRQIDEKKPQLEAARIELEEGQAAFSENAKKVQDARKELEDAKTAIEDARQELADAKAELEDAKVQIADGEKKIADGWKELADAEEEIADAQIELEDGRKELEDGKIEYEDGKREAEEEIADAEEKIADAEKELAELEVPEWTVEDRSGLPENIGYGDNAQRIANIGKVFPYMFFLIAALISLTTMTRMVEEERTQIGTLKALGYSKGEIASKYLKYAIYATIGGSIVGLLIGEKVIPYVIITAYGIMYTHMDQIRVPYQLSHGLFATALALLSTVGATWAACSKTLSATPAVLMRPPAPKEGKRVLLERIPFIWNRMSFSWKSTIRNLMRYKKRVLMTVFGISGCMGLMIVGYGISDSIMGIATLQYEQIQHYDVMLIGEDNITLEEKADITAYLEADEEIRQHASVMMKNMTAPDGKKEYSLYIIVPEDVEGFEDFMTFRDRTTKETFTLKENGAIATEKVMTLLDAQRGDEMILEDENGHEYAVTVGEICENYMSHFLYMTPEYYEQIFGEEPSYDEVMVQMTEMSGDEMEAVGERLLEMDGVLSISYTRTIMDQLEYMLTALDAVVLVLIISAGMLAFVVLYNLNNININERKRELATLKVLGFFDGEVSAYVYRENVLLTFMGILAGCVFGKLMHRFIIVTVEVDSYMFGRNIDLSSYIIAAGFTVLFSLIVNWVMHFKLKKIDMVESLKSVE